MHTGHPLIVGQLDITRKVMKVLNQASKDLTSSRRDVGSHGFDDVFGEVGVEAARLLSGRGAIGAIGLTVGRHCGRCERNAEWGMVREDTIAM